MGTAASRTWVPGSELGIWKPPVWPSKHTDELGRAKSFQEGGRWQNPWRQGVPSPASFFYDWFLAGRDESNIPDRRKLDETLPVKAPPWVGNSDFAPSTARMTWLGHATVLAEVEGSTFLTDPVFSSRASAVQFLGPKRYRGAACSVLDLPRITAVLVSHNHYDHLDLNSVKKLVEKQPWISWFVPSGSAEWLRSNTGVAKEKVKEFTWWEEATLEGEQGNSFKMVFTPANHWCKRSIADDNKCLWGSWAVIGPNKRFYFAGDTGYCEEFEKIGSQLGPFDMAAIPIGAYQPNWFMKYQHVHPGEAVEIHKDIRSKKSLGIHWGTFMLTTEYYLEPPVLLTSFMNRYTVNWHFILTSMSENPIWHLKPFLHKRSELDPATFVSTDIGGSVEA